jgi:hypothetical protein
MKIMNAATTSSDSETNLSPIHYGTYTINGNVITLSGFGVLNIILITVEEFTFSFTLTADGETGEYTANLSAPPISESARTKMLCKAWQIDALDIDEDSISDDDRQRYIDYYGPDWKDSLILKENEELGLIGTTVLFSRAGTYLVMYAKEDSEAGLAEWKWANGEETAFYYSWHNWNDDLSNHIAYIPVLTETSCIVQQERWRTIMVIRE